jgi:hypothetical protein
MDLTELAAILSRPLRPEGGGDLGSCLTEEEKALAGLCSSCTNVARELFDKLASLKVEGERGRGKVICMLLGQFGIKMRLSLCWRDYLSFGRS